jgi:hypothetical protein
MKIKFYKVIALPALLYGSEVWITNKKQQNLITAVEMRLLRFVKGCSRIDRLQNEFIRNELNITSITQYTEIIEEDGVSTLKGWI